MLSAAEGLVEFFELVDEGAGRHGAFVGGVSAYMQEEGAEGRHERGWR